MSEETMDGRPIMGKIVFFSIVIAVAIAATLYRLKTDPVVRGIDGTYSECAVSGGYRGQWIFQCPNQAAFHAAVDEFVRRNPNYKVTGLIATEK